MNTFEMIKKELEPKLKGKELTLESTFKDVNLDSFDLADLVYQMEEALNIVFEEDELMSLKTVGDVVKLIDSKKV
jgi:acyl carrier protein